MMREFYGVDFWSQETWMGNAVVNQGLCQLGHMRSRVRLRLVCSQLSAGFLLFRHFTEKLSKDLIKQFLITKERF